MRITILSHWFLPNKVGGSELAVYNYAKILNQRGHEVHVITQLDDKGLPGYEIMEGFHVHRIRRYRLRILNYLLYFMQVYRKVRELAPDVVHEQGISGLGFFVKRFLHLPYVIYPQGTEFYLASRLYRRFIIRPAFNNATARIALTQEMASKMNRLCPKEVNIIPNGVDRAKFEACSKNDARRRLGITEGERIILCVANLWEVKGHEYLIKAMVEVVHGHPEACMFIAGDGPLRDKIQDMVQVEGLGEKVVFSGFVPHDKIPEYMAAADIFVLPSLSEGMPLVLLEAMAAGLPIVATKVGGVPEIIKDGENGFLVEPSNSSELAKKIIFLLQNDDIRRLFSDNNTRNVKDYNWERVATTLEKVYIKAKNR
ncbi:glycosyltransferase family 4 protein [Chloroflexota bacterium]